MVRSLRGRPRAISRRLDDGVDTRAASLRLLKDAGSAANEARTVEAALAAAVTLVAQHQGWAVGHAYLPTQDGAACAPTNAWYVRPGLDAGPFRASTARTRPRAGVGLVGYVLEARRPLWVADLHKDRRWTRDDAALRLRSAVFYPVMAHGAVRAVLEFYSDRSIPPKPALESVISSVAFHLARVLERQEVSRRTAMAFEEEQRRVGQELHDRLGQSISALDWLARSLQQTLESGLPGAADKANELVHAIGVAKVELRRLARGLMPLDLAVGGGLPSALADLASRCRERYGIECRYEGGQKAELRDGATSAQLFRIAQEAIRNAAEHGQPTRIVVRLRAAGSGLTLEVRDDGRGFSAGSASEGMGMRIMEHRAELIGGTLEIHSALARGTVVTCLVPKAFL